MRIVLLLGILLVPHVALAFVSGPGTEIFAYLFWGGIVLAVFGIVATIGLLKCPKAIPLLLGAVLLALFVKSQFWRYFTHGNISTSDVELIENIASVTVYLIISGIFYLGASIRGLCKKEK